MNLPRPYLTVGLAVLMVAIVAAALLAPRLNRRSGSDRLVRFTEDRVTEVSNLVSLHIGAPTTPVAMPSAIRVALSPIFDANRRVAYIDQVIPGLCMVMPNQNCSNAFFLIHITNGHWVVFK